MTETILRQFGVYAKDTYEHRYTILFKKIMLDKPYYIRYNKINGLSDLRKTQSYVNFDLSTDKLKQVKGYYEVLIHDVKYSNKNCWIYSTNGFYVKGSNDVSLSDFTLSKIVQEVDSSNVVFGSRLAGEYFLQRRAPIDNEMDYTSDRCSLVRPYMFITEDLLGEDVPVPDRAIKQAKAREDRKIKKQNRLKLFEMFIEPTLKDEESLSYYGYSQSFSMPYFYAEKVLKKHLEEVVIPKFKELGVQMSVDDFDLRLLTYHCDISLNKVKLDNIDEVEQ
jgi:hypothetical protein